MVSHRRYSIEQTTVDKPKEKDWLHYEDKTINTKLLDDLCQTEEVAHSFSIGSRGRWVHIIDTTSGTVVWREHKDKKPSR